MSIITKEQSRAYSEVLAILDNISEEDLDKIPTKKIEYFKKNRDFNYNIKIDKTKPLEMQNITYAAKVVLAILYRDYWATDKQRNMIIAKQNYDLKQMEQENQEKYSLENYFKKNVSKYNMQEQSQEINNLPLETKKENLFAKIFKNILDKIRRNKK